MRKMVKEGWEKQVHSDNDASEVDIFNIFGHFWIFLDNLEDFDEFGPFNLNCFPQSFPIVFIHYRLI